MKFSNRTLKIIFFSGVFSLVILLLTLSDIIFFDKKCINTIWKTFRLSKDPSPKILDSKATKNFIGLDNYANSCYFNTCIQLLRPLKHLGQYLTNIDYQKNPKLIISSTLKQLFYEMDREQGDTMNIKLYFEQIASEIVKSQRINTLSIGKYNDAQDLLYHLIRIIVQEDPKMKDHVGTIGGSNNIVDREKYELLIQSESFKIFYYSFSIKGQDSIYNIRTHENHILESKNMQENLNFALKVGDEMEKIINIPKIIIFLFPENFLDCKHMLKDESNTLYFENNVYKLKSFSLFRRSPDHYMCCAKVSNKFKIFNDYISRDISSDYESPFGVTICTYELE